MSKPLRLLVLSVSAGAGHIRAAQAISTAAKQIPGVEIFNLDVLDLAPASFRKFYGSGYIKVVEKAPLIWAYLYQQTDKPYSSSVLSRFRQHIEQFNTRKLEEEIECIQPDIIICTHFLPAELLSRRIGKGVATPPVWVHVTDFDIHALWLHPHMSGYFVASDEVAARMAARGIPAGQIHVTGIAIMPQFSQSYSKAEALVRLGLCPEKATLLMMSGGAGVGDMETTVQQIAALPGEIQIVALAGRNQDLLHNLQKIARNHPTGRVIPQGFTNEIEWIMAAADIAITKPGGLTTSECLAMQLPMIIISPIPGQEERNADALLESGCALKAVDSGSLGYKLQLLVHDRERRESIQRQQKIMAKPLAAKTIVEIAINTYQTRSDTPC